jgi:hypothetical protein
MDKNQNVREEANDALTKLKETATPEDLERIEAWITLGELGLLESRRPDMSLSRKKDWAESPGTPARDLNWLSQDPEVYIRSSVAGNPNCPVEALDRLSQDEDDYVRWRVAKNSSASIGTLIRLVQDPDSDTRGMAIETLREIRDAALPEDQEQIDAWLTLGEFGLLESHSTEDPYLVRLKKLAWSPNTSEDLLKELAVHSDLTVRMGVARNPNMSTGLLKQMSQDPSNWVRIEVTKNPNITPDILFDLLMDSDEYVVAAARKKLPPDLAILADIF